MSNVKNVRLIECKNVETLAKAYYISSLFNNAFGDLIYIPMLDDAVVKRIKETLNFLGMAFEVLCFEQAAAEAKNIVGGFGEKLLDDFIEDGKIIDYLIRAYNSIYPRHILDGNNFGNEALRDKFQGQSIILAITDQGFEQALKFGMLSGRQIIFLESYDFDENIFRAMLTAKSITVCVSEHLGVTDIEGIINKKNKVGNDIPIGFFYPFGKHNREYMPIKSYIFSKCAIPADLPFNFFYPLERANTHIDTKRVRFVIGKGESEKSISILREPAEFIFATPHSNGVDMSLGPAVLCAKKDYCKEDFGEIYRAMPCFFEDICSRKNPNVELMGVSEVKSIVVFLYTCWGVILKGGVYDERGSLAYQFAQSPYTSILVTTYSMSLLDRNSGIFIAASYCNGDEIGKAVQDFNKLHYDRYKDTKNSIILFGDPEHRNTQNTALDIEGMISGREVIKENFVKSGMYDVGSNNTKVKKLNHTVIDIDKKFFSNMNFANCVIGSSQYLKNKEIEEPLNRFCLKTKDLWMFALLYQNRFLQKDEFYFDAFEMNKRFQYYLNEYQQGWFEFYKSMVSSLGGYIRFQVDRYFSLSIEDVSQNHKNCPYCNSVVKIEIKEMNPLGIKRRLIECLNCATIFDGLEEFMFGSIECNNAWKVGEKQNIQISVETKLGGTITYCIGIILEPFDKRKSNHIIYTKKNGSRILKDGLLCIDIDDITINEITPGCYHLNTIVLLNESVVFLRRAVYIVNELNVEREKPYAY